MLDQIESKTVDENEEGDRGKRGKTLSEVKTVENLQSFLEISPEQKEVLPSHKL